MKIAKKAFNRSMIGLTLGDPVLARRHPGDHEFRARVVGRSIGRHIYDVETADGARLQGLTLVRLDAEAIAAQRAALALDAAGQETPTPNERAT